MIKTIIFLALIATLNAADLKRQALFTSAQGGYAQYRIPGIVVTSKGSILAYAEARKSLRGDRGTIDIVLRRSTDQGATWSPFRVIASVDGAKSKNPVALAQKLATAALPP